MSDDSVSWKKEHENSFVRRLLDSPFILLLISLLIVFTSYSIWGTIELMKVPSAPKSIEVSQ